MNTTMIHAPFPAGEVVQISGAPHLFVVDGFMSDVEIEAIKAIGDSVEQLEAHGFTITRGAAGRSVDLPSLGETMAAVAARIEDLVGARDALDDSMRFRRYHVGELHRRHTDAVYPVEGLHLLVTTLVCLDAPVVGGETLFPYAQGGPIAVAHRRGRAIIWCNYARDGAVDRTAIHEGLVVRAGTKATIGKFLHRRLSESGTLIDNLRARVSRAGAPSPSFDTIAA